MFKNVNNGQLNQDNLDQHQIKKLEETLVGLTDNILALRVELIADHRKLESYFKVLSQQIYDMKKDLDYLHSYLDIEIAELINKDRNDWISIS